MKIDKISQGNKISCENSIKFAYKNKEKHAQVGERHRLHLKPKLTIQTGKKIRYLVWKISQIGF